MTASDHLENLGTDGRIILKWVYNKEDENMDWIGVTQSGDKWVAVVQEVMNRRFRKNVRNYLTGWGMNLFSTVTLLYGVI